jgi:hypothetical protein
MNIQTRARYQAILATGDNIRSKLVLRNDHAAVYWRELIAKEIRKLQLQMATESSEVQS